MRLKIFPTYDEENNQYNWHTWFAWHPIWVDGTVVWLELVYRRRAMSFTKNWNYKTID
jgi:hypothetical protein